MAMTNDDSDDALQALRDWFAAFPGAAHRFVIRHGEFLGTPIWFGLCLEREPSLVYGDFGRVTSKDAAENARALKIGFPDPERVHALPDATRRLAFLYEDDVLVVVPFATFKGLSIPVVELIELKPGS